jgi:hypothetical protein
VEDWCAVVPIARAADATRLGLLIMCLLGVCSSARVHRDATRDDVILDDLLREHGVGASGDGMLCDATAA